jgi:uncharacterized Zn-binding protein involved in type VI secretion
MAITKTGQAARLALFGVIAVASLGSAAQGLPAARLTDAVTSSLGPGGTIQGPGAITVLIGGLPAARVTDLATCALRTPAGAVVVSQPITTGSSTVLIGALGAARVSDSTLHPCTIDPPGEPTVLIGN